MKTNLLHGVYFVVDQPPAAINSRKGSLSKFLFKLEIGKWHVPKPIYNVQVLREGFNASLKSKPKHQSAANEARLRAMTTSPINPTNNPSEFTKQNDISHFPIISIIEELK